MLIIAFLLLTFTATQSALASSPCEAEYQAALAELAEGHLDRGSQQKIQSHIQNAWRMADRNNTDAALQQLDVALEQLAGSPTKRMPAGSRERLTKRVSSMRTCLARGSSGTATIVITTAYLAEGIEAQPTGAGVHLRVNGETLGKTDEYSSARVTVPAGTIEVTAVVPSSAIGSERLRLDPGEWRELTLLLDDTKEVTEPNPLVLHQLSEGVISASFDAFVLSFAGESGKQPLQGFDYIHIKHPKGGMPVRIDHLFTLSDSSEMVAHDLEQLRGLLAQQPHGPITILAQAYDEEGFTYANTVQFYLGRHRILGQLVAPPSFPGLDPGDIEISVAG